MITNYKEIKEYIDRQSFLEERIKEICQILVPNGALKNINNWDVIRWDFIDDYKSVQVTLEETWARGGYDNHAISFDVEYIWMSDDDILLIVTKNELNRLILIKQKEAEQKIEADRVKEERELKEFERLKNKFQK